MGYGRTLEKAWGDIDGLTDDKRLSVKFLADTYDVDLDGKSIISASCNVPAKDHIAIIILHYLIRKFKLKELSPPTGEWVDFNQIEGGEGYYPTFKKRTIDRILTKYGSEPQGLLKVAELLPAKQYNKGDVGIVIYPFPEVPVLITMWKADEEFGPDANMLFDKNISDIFCTEDIVVLAEFIAHII